MGTVEERRELYLKGRRRPEPPYEPFNVTRLKALYPRLAIGMRFRDGVATLRVRRREEVEEEERKEAKRIASRKEEGGEMKVANLNGGGGGGRHRDKDGGERSAVQAAEAAVS